MGKKKKKSSAKHNTGSKQSVSEMKKWSKYPSIALAVGASLLITGFYFLTQGEELKKPPVEPAKLKKEDKRLRETGATLSPLKFRGGVRRAYEIAREIPEVLDRLYCYCRCKENFNHKNLLSCYVGTHAAN